ncbi:MAG: hypothetical protein HYX60_02915 [Legionella longbeachae]|nr:hypothetical protein [Legionella longbeachae]
MNNKTIKLLILKQVNNLAQEEKIKFNFSGNIAGRIAQYIITKGIEDEKIEKLISQLINKEVMTHLEEKVKDNNDKKDYLKKMVDKILEDNNFIIINKLPLKNYNDQSKKQRLLDSISRILSIRDEYVPCIAVALVQGSIIIASNSPKKINEKTLTKGLTQKIDIVQYFLLTIKKHEYVDESFALKIAKMLASQELGVGNILPQKKKEKRSSSITHLQNALLKIGHDYLLGILSNGKEGELNSAELSCLTNPEFIVITPSSLIKEGNIHAEQAILAYLKTIELTESVNIGISKLCCQACHEVLSSSDIEISYRGTHGISFPSVYNINTNKCHEGEKTLMIDDMCASDSDSEHENSFSFLNKKEARTETLIESCNLFFKGCATNTKSNNHLIDSSIPELNQEETFETFNDESNLLPQQVFSLVTCRSSFYYNQTSSNSNEKKGHEENTIPTEFTNSTTNNFFPNNFSDL